MFQGPRSAGGDNRNCNHIGDGFGEFQIKTGLGTVGIHTGQQYFTGPPFLTLFGPGNRIQPGSLPAAVSGDFPTLTI